jgi:hypothetical protein
MNALTESIPGLIEDEKEQKKAKREADKILFTLGEATRLEGMGLDKEARERKEKAADSARQLQQTLSTAASSAASDASREKTSRYTADLQLEAEKIRAKTAAASAAASRLDANERKLNDQYIAAGNSAARTYADVAKERSADDYKELIRLSALPEAGSDIIKKQRSDAITRLGVINKDHEKRVDRADKLVKQYEQKVLGDAAPTGMSATERRAAEQWLAAHPNDARAANIRRQLSQ